MTCLVLILLVLYIYRRIRPMKDLKYIDAKSLSCLIKKKTKAIRILDIRDSIDYYADHIEGAVHISLGRLPYVKKTGLHVEDEIILISNSTYKSKKPLSTLNPSKG